VSRSTLGDIIRRQRELQDLSVRQFARLAGISNPYLSQIERGLREPSEQVLESIARGLETTVDVLYAQAGMEPPSEPDAGEDGQDVIAAIEADPRLSPRGRKALIAVYRELADLPPPRPRSRTGTQ